MKGLSGREGAVQSGEGEAPEHGNKNGSFSFIGGGTGGEIIWENACFKG